MVRRLQSLQEQIGKRLADGVDPQAVAKELGLGLEKILYCAYLPHHRVFMRGKIGQDCDFTPEAKEYIHECLTKGVPLEDVSRELGIPPKRIKRYAPMNDNKLQQPKTNGHAYTPGELTPSIQTHDSPSSFSSEDPLASSTTPEKTPQRPNKKILNKETLRWSFTPLESIIGTVPEETFRAIGLSRLGSLYLQLQHSLRLYAVGCYQHIFVIHDEHLPQEDFARAASVRIQRLARALVQDLEAYAHTLQHPTLPKILAYNLNYL